MHNGHLMSVHIPGWIDYIRPLRFMGSPLRSTDLPLYLIDLRTETEGRRPDSFFPPPRPGARSPSPQPFSFPPLSPGAVTHTPLGCVLSTSSFSVPLSGWGGGGAVGAFSGFRPVLLLRLPGDLGSGSDGAILRQKNISSPRSKMKG